MNVILDDDASWSGRPDRWVGGREPYILTTEVLVSASEADGVFRPVEWFSQVLSNGPREDGGGLLELDRVDCGHAGRVDAKK